MFGNINNGHEFRGTGKLGTKNNCAGEVQQQFAEEASDVLVSASSIRSMNN
jgi:hypothetical protein